MPPPTLPPTPPPTILNIGITTSAAPLATLIAEPYEDDNSGAILNFVEGNNAVLFNDLESGVLDAILVHHIPESSTVWFNPVAVDGLVAVVHPQNAIRSLQRSELQRLFSGQIEDWSAVGGAETPVVVYGRERGAGTRRILNERIMAEQRVTINAIIAPSDAALLAAVASEPDAIGYSMMGAASGAEVIPLTVDGIPPSPQTTAAQTYPLTAPLYFVSPAEPQGALRGFLAWLQSDIGQSVLDEIYGRVR